MQIKNGSAKGHVIYKLDNQKNISINSKIYKRHFIRLILRPCNKAVMIIFLQLFN